MVAAEHPGAPATRDPAPPRFGFPRTNNLEWLRLLFALQVVLEHGAEHLGFVVPGILAHFPGVPAFFFVSGFLVYASYLHAPGKTYFRNRLLRLYPGLVFVTLGGTFIVLLSHGWRSFMDNASTITVWFVAQTTLGQAYNPALFRGIGVGVINGALWTLTTEILFYALVPAIALFERRFRHVVIALSAMSFAVYAVGPVGFTDPVYRGRTLYDFIALTPLAWGWMFGCGILAVKNFQRLSSILKYLPVLLIPLGLMIAFGSGLFFGSSGNRLGVVYFLCYIALLMWLAFGSRPLPLKIDLSYGTYIWHMPIINLALVLGLSSPWLVIVTTFAVALLSWFFVEKPFLRRKQRSLRSIDA